jgi:hypothetical protein
LWSTSYYNVSFRLYTIFLFQKIFLFDIVKPRCNTPNQFDYNCCSILFHDILPKIFLYTTKCRKVPLLSAKKRQGLDHHPTPIRSTQMPRTTQNRERSQTYLPNFPHSSDSIGSADWKHPRVHSHKNTKKPFTLWHR